MVKRKMFAKHSLGGFVFEGSWSLKRYRRRSVGTGGPRMFPTLQDSLWLSEGHR